MRRLHSICYYFQLVQLQCCHSSVSIVIIFEIKDFVRSGIRTHAQRTGLRPERSALDRSAILTCFYF